MTFLQSWSPYSQGGGAETHPYLQSKEDSKCVLDSHLTLHFPLTPPRHQPHLTVRPLLPPTSCHLTLRACSTLPLPAKLRILPLLPPTASSPSLHQPLRTTGFKPDRGRKRDEVSHSGAGPTWVVRLESEVLKAFFYTLSEQKGNLKTKAHKINRPRSQS